MILLKLLVLQLIIVFIIDLSGFIDDGIEPALAKIFKKNKVTLKKPWSCSLCMTTWTGLLYLIITGHFTLFMVGYVLLLAYLTPVSYNILITIKEALIKITSINF